MVEVKITYETLFDLLRREKSRNELQELEPTFFVDVVTYLREKSSALEVGEKSALTSRAEQEKIKIQIKNIQRILKELYELREKKILNLAVNKIRTGSRLIDTSKMLNEEKQLFDESALLLNKFQRGILGKITTMNLPDIHLSSSNIAEIEERNDEELENTHESDEGKTEQKDVSVESSTQIKTDGEGNKDIQVKFLTSLPKFVGLDKKIYGPFESGCIDTIPSQVAELLLKKGRIEKV